MSCVAHTTKRGSVISAAPPLLVTGLHRSGSTWVGRTLATAQELFYIHEPLNPNFAPHYIERSELPYYWKMTEADARQVLPSFQRLLSGHFPRIDARFFRPERRFISRFPQALAFRWAAFHRKRFLIKDPFMLFNVEWFEQQFGGPVVLVTRSPLAFVASLKAKNWTFDFRNFTLQPTLMDGPLAAHREAIEAAAANPPDLIDQGCLLWKVLHGKILSLQAADPSRIICRHEDLLAQPVDAFRELFDRLGLAWSPRVERTLIKRQGTRAGFDQEAAPLSGGEINFDTLWQTRLNPEEIERIQIAEATFASGH